MVFEAFTQVDSSLERSAGGLGLGLPLVRGLARLHGGDVHAASGGLGRGSEFTIVLPRRVATVQPSASRPPPPPRPPRRVLLVDDFLDALDILKLGLELAGCSVETASDGLSAIEKARSGSYDVAFVDIGLPGVDGFTVARTLRAEPATRSLPLVAMSGYGSPEDRDRSAASGFDAHLVKPVAPAALLAAADEIVAGRRGDA
jgi:CheY-like chemotaxis protein